MWVQIGEFFKVFLFLPLQFFNFGEMPLQFSYSEICHYNSSYIRILPFYTSFTCLGPLSDRICVRIFRMDENTTAALLPPLNDVRAPLVRFFFNLRAGARRRRREPEEGRRTSSARGGRRGWRRRWLPTGPLALGAMARAEAAAATCVGEGGGISRPPLLAPGRSRAAAAPAARRAGRRTGLLVPRHRGSAPTPGRRTSALPRLRAAAPPPRRRAPTSRRSCPASPLTPAILFLPGHTSSLPSRSAAELAGLPPLTLPLRSSRRSSG